MDKESVQVYVPITATLNPNHKILNQSPHHQIARLCVGLGGAEPNLHGMFLGTENLEAAIPFFATKHDVQDPQCVRFRN